MPNNDVLMKIWKSTLDGIANAIRRKDGTQASIPGDELESRIDAIPTGSTFYGDTFFDLIYGEPSE